MQLLSVGVLCAASAWASVDVPGCSSSNKTAADASCQGYDCLYNYVNKKDDSFTWEDTGLRLYGHNEAILPKNKVNWTGYVLNFTSQKWLEPEDFNFSWCGGRQIGHVWFHTLVVVVPSNLRNPYPTNLEGLLYMTGGNNDGAKQTIPAAKDEDVMVVSSLAMQTGTIGAALFQVPNQHLVFADDPKQQHRSEDAVIAFTWQKYVEDPTLVEWPLRLPMTKAGVKALDVLTEWGAQQETPVTMEKFVVAGASKRGWTTWTVASVDERVVAAVPIVMDELNFMPNIHHHFRAYGGWSFALKDYYDLNFTRCLDHPNTADLMKIVDPYWYMEKLAHIPKLVIDSGADEFFLPDDSTYWVNKMPGETHLLMIPNAEHSEATGILEILPNVGTFVNRIIEAQPRPTHSWTINATTGDITLTLGPDVAGLSVDKVHMWHATTCNSKRRDFRIINNGWGPPGSDPGTHCLPCGIGAKGLCTNELILWTDTLLEETSSGSRTYVAHRDLPKDGKWTAFFIDVTMKGDGATKPKNPNKGDVGNWPFLPFGDFEFTTAVSVIPHTFPFDECVGETCLGSLV